MAGGATGIRWGRAVVGALLIELMLGFAAVPVFYLAADPGPALNMMIPPASFVAALLAGIWVAGASARPVASGIAAGVIAVLFYVVLGVGAYLLAPEQADLRQSTGLPYLASHALKILGAAAGGYWVQRRREPA